MAEHILFLVGHLKWEDLAQLRMFVPRPPKPAPSVLWLSPSHGHAHVDKPLTHRRREEGRDVIGVHHILATTFQITAVSQMKDDWRRRVLVHGWN